MHNLSFLELRLTSHANSSKMLVTRLLDHLSDLLSLFLAHIQIHFLINFHIPHIRPSFAFLTFEFRTTWEIIICDSTSSAACSPASKKLLDDEWLIFGDEFWVFFLSASCSSILFIEINYWWLLFHSRRVALEEASSSFTRENLLYRTCRE